MTLFNVNGTRALTIAALIMGAVSRSALAAPPAGRNDSGPPRIELTAEDVAASNEKIRGAYAALVDMWTTDFRRVGERFAAPRVARYRTVVRTGCGVMQPNNAGYCPTDNTIYYDDVFVAGMGKSASKELGTDGDMASIGVIAHEMGHAVAMQLGHSSRSSYENEATADCLAGAFAKRSQADGSLEPGDIDEAVYGMSTAGDPTPEPTGSQRLDQRIARQIARSSHGTRDQRMENFRTGLAGGAGACLAELR